MTNLEALEIAIDVLEEKAVYGHIHEALEVLKDMKVTEEGKDLEDTL